MAKIDLLEKQVGEINTAISGNEKMGIPGIVNMLAEHIAQTKKNNDELLKTFKDFKRDLVHDYAEDFNRVDEKMNWTDGRVKVLEEIDRASTKKIGFFLGFGIVAGFVISNLDTIVKFFYGE